MLSLSQILMAEGEEISSFEELKATVQKRALETGSIFSRLTLSRRLQRPPGRLVRPTGNCVFFSEVNAMFWQEDEDKTLPYIAPDDVLDVSFAIQCKQLPLDHAWDLSQAIQQALPWFMEEAVAGVHPIHVAESGNGWERPDDPSNQFLLPSHRTRLFLRIPKGRVAVTQALSGATLDVGGYAVGLRDMKKKPFTHTSVIFARYVLSSEQEDENSFLRRMARK